MAMPFHVTDEQFEPLVLQADKPVVVDFWAEWCGPCLMMAPLLEQLADELRDLTSFAKLNVDEYPPISSMYGVNGIPTLVVFSRGQEIGRLVGLAPKAAIQTGLEEILEGQIEPVGLQSE